MPMGEQDREIQIMKSEEKVNGEQSLSICPRTRAKSRQCEIIREPGTIFSCCIAHCHMILWEPYGSAQTEMRQMQRQEIALVGAKHSGKTSSFRCV